MSNYLQEIYFDKEVWDLDETIEKLKKRDEKKKRVPRKMRKGKGK